MDSLAMSESQVKKSLRVLIPELHELNGELRLAREREIGGVMDALLRTMKDWSISIAELDRHRCRRMRASTGTAEFRDPITGDLWSGRGAPPKWFVGGRKA
jgi:DNA-binding protein H-NS